MCSQGGRKITEGNSGQRTGSRSRDESSIDSGQRNYFISALCPCLFAALRHGLSRKMISYFTTPPILSTRQQRLFDRTAVAAFAAFLFLLAFAQAVLPEEKSVLWKVQSGP